MDAGLLDTKSKAKAKAVMAREPNCIWVGEGEPPVAVNVGNLWIDDLPEPAKQRKGFYSEHAHLLRAVFNGYKQFIGKGGE